MTEEQFEIIFKKYFNTLANTAYSIVKDRDMARDVSQQTFIKLWKIRTKVDITDNIEAYLKRAAINTAINELERSRRIIIDGELTEYSAIEHIENDKPEYSDNDLQKITQKAISELPEKCAIVFNLSRYEGMTNKEIADYLNISIKAVEKHITKAIRDLRIKLEPYRNLLPIIIYIMVGF